MLKKPVIIFVVFLCCISILTGCDNNRVQKKENKDILDEIPFINSDRMDFGGKNFTIYMFNQGLEDEKNKLIFDIIEKRNNIGNIVFDIDSTYMQFTTNLATKVLAKAAPEIVLGGSVFYLPSAKKNLLQNISDIADGMMKDSVFYQTKFSSSLVNQDKIYGLGDGGINSIEGLFYNPRMIKDAGLESPIDLYMKNKWTFDMFLDYCRKLTKDTNGDGEFDIYGVASAGAFANGRGDLGNFITANGAPLVRRDEKTGRYLENLIDDKKAHNALDFITKLYGDPIAAYPRMNFEKAKQMFEEERVAFITANKGYIKDVPNAQDDESPRIFKDALFVGFPRGPEATDKTYHTIMWGEGITSVGAGKENAKDCLRVMEQIYVATNLLKIGALRDDSTIDTDIIEEVANQLKQKEAKNKLFLTDYFLLRACGENAVPDGYEKVIRKIVSFACPYYLAGEDNYRLKASDIVTDARYNNMAPTAATAMRSPAMQEEIDRIYNGNK